MTAGSISYTRGEDPLRADKLNASFSERLLATGDTMLGPLILSRSPVLPFEAATKQYTDNVLTTGFLPLTGGTLTGNLVLQNNLHIAGPSGTTRSLNFDNSNLTNRWLLTASAIAESGGNVGSDFGITPAADNGAPLPTVLTIKRSTGLVTIATGLTISGGALTLSGNAASALQAVPLQQLNSVVGGYLPLTGGSLSGNLIVTNNVHITGASGGTRALYFDTGATNRWLLTTSAVAEGGSNAGSDFGITPAADNGAPLATALSIKRSTGVVTIGVGLAVTGTASVIDTSGSFVALTVQNTTSGSGAGIALTGNGATTPSKYIRVANGRLDVVNSAFSAVILSLTDQGRLLVGLSTPDDGTTMLQVAGSATVSGTLAVGGGNTISTAGQILAGFGVFGATGTPTRGGFVGSWCPNNNNYQGLWSDGSGNLTFSGADLAGIPGATMGYFHAADKSFWVLGSAFKPGGGVWTDSSDIRIKNVHGDYSAGLDAVCALQPKRYSYRGNDQDVPAEDAEPGPSPHAGVAGREFVGLIAQEAEGPMPELVTKRAGLIDGEAVDDLRSLDASALLYALVNSCRELRDGMVRLDAFKELDARLHRLEART